MVVGQEVLFAGEVPNCTPLNTEPTFFKHSLSVSPTQVLDAQSNGNFELGTGKSINAWYNSDVNEMNCIKESCNKRISDARLER